MNKAIFPCGSKNTNSIFRFDGTCVLSPSVLLPKIQSSCRVSTEGASWRLHDDALLSQSSFGAQGYTDSLSYPAGREQLLCEGTVEGVESGLAIAVVGQRPCFIVQQHANATVLRIAHQSLLLAIVPSSELLIVKLQAP